MTKIIWRFYIRFLFATTAIIILSNHFQAVHAQEINDTSGVIYTILDEMPDFQGGTDAFISFLGSNIQYSDTVEKFEIVINAKAYVEFVVEKDGSITHVRLKEGTKRIGYGCDEEAVRVISIMPKWIPGKNKGVPVRVRMLVPVFFKH